MAFIPGPIKLVDGKSASTHEQQIERWKQHFLAVLNCPEPDITHDFDNDVPFIAELHLCPDKTGPLDIVNNCVKLMPALTKLNAHYFYLLSRETRLHITTVMAAQQPGS